MASSGSFSSAFVHPPLAFSFSLSFTLDFEYNITSAAERIADGLFQYYRPARHPTTSSLSVWANAVVSDDNEAALRIPCTLASINHDQSSIAVVLFEPIMKSFPAPESKFVAGERFRTWCLISDQCSLFLDQPQSGECHCCCG